MNRISSRDGVELCNVQRQQLNACLTLTSIQLNTRLLPSKRITTMASIYPINALERVRSSTFQEEKIRGREKYLEDTALVLPH